MYNTRNRLHGRAHYVAYLCSRLHTIDVARNILYHSLPVMTILDLHRTPAATATATTAAAATKELQECMGGLYPPAGEHSAPLLGAHETF